MTQPALAVSVTGRGRMYRHPLTNELYPSITNIIEVLEKPWLGRWAAKFVAGAAWDSRFALMKIEDREQAVDMLKGAPWRKTKKAGDLGGDIHAVAEAIAADEPGPLPAISDEAVPYVDGFLSFVAEFDPAFQILEGTVFNDTHQYAGTFDFLAVIEGLLILGDYKTGGGVYDEVALQLAAARFAESVWNKHSGQLSPMPRIDGCIAVHLQPGKSTVFTVGADREAFYAFLGLRQAWPWNKDHTGALGPRMNKVRLVREFSSGAKVDGAGDGLVATAPDPVVAHGGRDTPGASAPIEDSPAAETEGEGAESKPEAGAASSRFDSDPASPAGDQAVLG